MILLTGATGTAGSFIANEFVREGEYPYGYWSGIERRRRGLKKFRPLKLSRAICPNGAPWVRR